MKTSAKALFTASLLTVQLAAFAGPVPMKLYKNPNCFCCDLYARHMEENGFKVELINTTEMSAIKEKHAIPEKLEGCHTALVDGYVVEGLVPAKFVQQLLKERPAIKGLALPGMPVGAPGMDGPKSQPLTVYQLGGLAMFAPRAYGTF